MTRLGSKDWAPPPTRSRGRGKRNIIRRARRTRNRDAGLQRGLWEIRGYFSRQFTRKGFQRIYSNSNPACATTVSALDDTPAAPKRMSSSSTPTVDMPAIELLLQQEGNVPEAQARDYLHRSQQARQASRFC